MSGHSKWSTIKRAKGANDAKRSSTFTKLSRAITVAAKLGGGDIDSNSRLRLAVEKAKDERMPKDVIQKAIDKGSGKTASENIEEIVYEGYGPEGVAFMINTMTDNKNRTVAELRTLLSRAGGSLGTSGSTAYIFADPENPLFTVDIEEKELAERLVKLAEDLEDHDDVQEIYTNFNLLIDL